MGTRRGWNRRRKSLKGGASPFQSVAYLKPPPGLLLEEAWGGGAGPFQEAQVPTSSMSVADEDGDELSSETSRLSERDDAAQPVRSPEGLAAGGGGLCSQKGTTVRSGLPPPLADASLFRPRKYLQEH